MGDDGWIPACATDAIEPEDVLRFDFEGHTLAIYRTADDRYFATAGLCTHEGAHLADGLIMGCIVECPKHNGRFDFTTGKAVRRPARVDLRTYEVRVEGATVFVRLA